MSAHSRNDADFEAISFGTTVESAVNRYKIRRHPGVLSARRCVKFLGGAARVETTALDADYGVVRRVKVTEGSWFADTDVDRMEPALVVNSAFWALMGSPNVRTHPTVRILGAHPVTAVIVGCAPRRAVTCRTR